MANISYTKNKSRIWFENKSANKNSLDIKEEKDNNENELDLKMKKSKVISLEVLKKEIK